MCRGDTVLTDQRGVPRPQGARCDIGAYEGPCGDGVLDPGEVCDDEFESAACDIDCTLAECGDATPNATAGEACDDGNPSNADACLTTCEDAVCGDGFVWADVETCDDEGESATCDTDCTAAQCGDGVLNVTAGEVCDKDDDAACGGQRCRRNCTCAPLTCGNGVRDAGEACDGPTDGLCRGLGCRPDCTCRIPKPLSPTPKEVATTRLGAAPKKSKR